jgi:hypothetical protein
MYLFAFNNVSPYKWTLISTILDLYTQTIYPVRAQAIAAEVIDDKGECCQWDVVVG